MESKSSLRAKNHLAKRRRPTAGDSEDLTTDSDEGLEGDSAGSLGQEEDEEDDDMFKTPPVTRRRSVSFYYERRPFQIPHSHPNLYPQHPHTPPKAAIAATNSVTKAVASAESVQALPSPDTVQPLPSPDTVQAPAPPSSPTHMLQAINRTTPNSPNHPKSHIINAARQIRSVPKRQHHQHPYVLHTDTHHTNMHTTTHSYKHTDTHTHTLTHTGNKAGAINPSQEEVSCIFKLIVRVFRWLLVVCHPINFVVIHLSSWL